MSVPVLRTDVMLRKQASVASFARGEVRCFARDEHSLSCTGIAAKLATSMQEETMTAPYDLRRQRGAEACEAGSS